MVHGKDLIISEFEQFNLECENCSTFGGEDEMRTSHESRLTARLLH